MLNDAKERASVIAGSVLVAVIAAVAVLALAAVLGSAAGLFIRAVRYMGGF